ncbi:MAG: caspase family protein [Spirochaetaceae bacterium]|jgi:hypothetical protein|nr:caspase family protein [Spirochaetaceae bacterium]
MKEKLIRISLLLILLPAYAAYSEPGRSGARRLGVFIGSNDGGPRRAVLRWADRDARAVSAVFTELGGVASADAFILTNPSVRDITARLERVSAEIRASASRGARTELIFYYSGHSDETGLLLGRERLDYRTLRERINAVPGDMRIVILDSCSSGAFTRAKGGEKIQAFLLDEQSEAQGYAFLTSSSANEASQESDAIRGSFFTHSLLAGLRGSASAAGNGRVTLNEAYRYAYDETLLKTERAQFGRQHPSYDIQLSGIGDVVLTDVRGASAGIIFGASVAGRLSVRDGGGFLIAEITKPAGKLIELALPPEAYRILLRRQIDMFAADLNLQRGKREEIDLKDFSAVTLEQAIARGDLNEAGELETDPPETAGADAPAVERQPVRVGFFGGLRSDDEVKTSAHFLFGVIRARVWNLEGFGLGLIGLEIENKLKGMQVSSAYNVAGYNAAGFQVAGILNIHNGEMRGGQIAGVLNYAGGGITGMQASLIANIAGRNSKGFQIGLVNIMGEGSSGGQFGLVNVSRGEDGVSAGLINIVKNGLLNPAVYYGDLGLLNISLKSGSSRTYFLWRFGLKIPPEEGFNLTRNNEWAASCGFGREWRYKRAFLDLDWSWGYFSGMSLDEWFSPEDSDSQDWSNFIIPFAQIRFSGGFNIFRHLGLFGGISYILAVTENSEAFSSRGFFWDIGPFKHGLSIFGGLQF